MEVFTAAGLSALLQVIAIDLVLAGDNAIVIGLAAAGLPAAQRNRVLAEVRTGRRPTVLVPEADALPWASVSGVDWE